MANSLISMIKGDSTLIDNTEVLDGQVLFDTTNQKILLDDESERKEYGGTIKKGEIAYVESAMVTTRGYSAGDYIIVQDTLYKVTTQINSGTTLVVGTNVSVTTVGGEITQINNDLSVFSFRNNNGVAQYSMNDGSTWTNFKNPVGTKYIYSNGTYDVTNYASAYVSVTADEKIRLIVNGDHTYVPISKGSLTTVSTSGSTMTIKNGSGAVANEYFAFNVNLYQLVHQVFGLSVTSVKFTITNYSYTHTLSSRTLGLKSSAGKYDGSGFAFDSQGSSVSFTVDVESTLNSYKYLGTGAQDGKQCSFDSITISKVS